VWTLGEARSRYDIHSLNLTINVLKTQVNIQSIKSIKLLMPAAEVQPALKQHNNVYVCTHKLQTGVVARGNSY